MIELERASVAELAVLGPFDDIGLADAAVEVCVLTDEFQTVFVVILRLLSQQSLVGHCWIRRVTCSDYSCGYHHA